MSIKSKQKTIRLSLEHPIQKRILELAESGKPVKLKDGRYVIATDFLRELLVLGYNQVVDEINISTITTKVVPNITPKQKADNLDSMTEPI